MSETDSSENKRPEISIRGARANNLQGFDLILPRNQLISVTGVSGSGKSSLVTNILQREGSRRYLETFSGYSRQFIQKSGVGDADSVTGIPPVVFLDQHRPPHNPRSTASTVAGLEPLLRLLFARIGIPHCTSCQQPLQTVTDDELAESLQLKYTGTICLVAAPLVEDRKGHCRSVLDYFRKSEWQQIRINGQLYRHENLPVLATGSRHQIAIITGNAKDATPGEFCEALKQALQLTRGRVQLILPDETLNFTTDNCCLDCARSISKIGPRLFSFNGERGACPRCTGLGVVDYLDPELMIKNPALSLRQGALHLSTPNGYIMYSQVTLDVLDSVCQAHGFSVDIPWKELSSEHREVLYYGSQKLKVPFGKHPLENRLKWKGITAKPREEGFYPGFLTIMEGILKRDRNPGILRFVRSVTCEACSGHRLGPEALAVTVAGRNICDLLALEFTALEEFLRDLQTTLPPAITPLITELLRQLKRFDVLCVGYLNGSRITSTLSGGEYQRLRLATRLNSDLSGLLYLLDEPSTGLHLRDRERLTGILRTLRNQGNTVLTIEHDPDAMLRADWLTEIGPGAGKNGGQLLFNGPTADFMALPEDSTPTRRTLNPEFRHYPTPAATSEEYFEIQNCRLHNLKNLTVPCRFQAINTICGVSGAGKSSLLDELETFASQNQLFDSIIRLDQSPIGRTPRSNPATYTGLADLIRDRFAALPEARTRDYGKSRFSFNVKGGRCEYCEGSGCETTTLHFLENVSIPCSWCDGKRFNPETLEIIFSGCSIADVYQLSVDQAAELFAEEKKIIASLQTLQTLGLGYLTLGQPSSTLSGGEAQRIRLAAELNSARGNRRLYLLDEPSSGLHPQDLAALLDSFQQLLQQGHTLVLVEHHPTLLCQSSHLIELGPGSGVRGGELLFTGTLQQLLETQTATAVELHNHLQKDFKIESCRAQPACSTPPITIAHATTNNLKSVSVVIPAQKMTVVTGVSGSGKSSLISETLVQKAHNEFLKGIPLYARRMIGMETPDVEADFTGLTPVVHLNQQRPSTSSLATVGTSTEIWNDLRLLYSRFGYSATGANELSMSHFSFFHPLGCCLACGGKGTILEADPEKLLTDETGTVYDRVFSGTKGGAFFTDPDDRYLAILQQVERELNLSLQRPWHTLTSTEKNIVLRGCPGKVFSVDWQYKRGNREGIHTLQEEWKGFLPLIEEEYEKRKASSRGDIFRSLMKDVPCPECQGLRLNPQTLSVKMRNLNIAECGGLELPQLVDWLDGLRAGCETDEILRLSALIPRIQRRLDSLQRLGLSHLTLTRSIATLSSGELQRVRLAALINSELSGLTIVLDEPSASLHGRNVEELLIILAQLKTHGNTLIVVEHNEQFIEAADQIIDLGPGGGTEGGEVIFQGPLDQFHPGISPTAQELQNARNLKTAGKSFHQPLQFIAIRGNNLQPADLKIPRNQVTAICGVSGSGKSTLLRDVICNTLQSQRARNCLEIKNINKWPSCRYISRSDVNRSGQTMVGDVTGAFSLLQKMFATSQTAMAAGLTSASFSLTGSEGRCPRCQGRGIMEVTLDYLGISQQPCPICQGQRYQDSVLACECKGKNLSDCLTMSLTEMAAFFSESPVAKKLQPAISLGLGYLQFGQSLASLSGGENQRLSLSETLADPTITDSVLLLDEPGTGLHGQDLTRVSHCFENLIARGNTIIIVEHRLLLLARMDHLIELGPGAGKDGGQILFSGSPMELAQENTATGILLKNWMNH